MTLPTAADFIDEIKRMPRRDTASVRKLRRRLSDCLSKATPEYVTKVASELTDSLDRRWVAYELITNHKESYLRLDARRIEKLGHGVDSWHSVDAFARILTGPAWRDGLIDDETIHRWAQSDDRWWRRVALVSTVALNMRTYGGTGDASRTLAVCQMLVADHDDMVVKALSWALRELVVHDADVVARFVDTHANELAARVKREVRNKLNTGLKNRAASLR